MKNDIWDATQSALIEQELPAETRSPMLDTKVMMVDDEPYMTGLIQIHLEKHGYRNFVASNDPTQALELLRREQPGVLLLDLKMPQVSGFDLLEAIRADRELRYTPVIVLTAATGADTKLRALQLGATDFLSKPVDASELVLRVRNTVAFQRYNERLIDFDQITGLPRERMFEAGVDELLTQPPGRGGLLALFSITVPQCRELRQSVDRRTAEALAVVIARRLKRLAAPAAQPVANADMRQPLVARLDEQHYGLVIDGLPDTDAVEAAARTVLAALAEPVVLGHLDVMPVPWLGIAVAPGDGQSATTLRQGAELAATHAQRHAATQISFASSQLNAKSLQRLTLGARLRGAAQRDELRLHYQPKVELSSGRIVGAEALVRWQHPELGLLPPMQFIPLAEELGLMPAIGQWVIERACHDAAGWMRLGLSEIKVAVNVTKPQFVTGDLCRVVRQAMFDSGLPARQLMIELTESMLMDNQQALSLMHELKSLGVSLSVDDFGTGYSSLAYLKRFPLDELKIDRSFVIDLPGQASDVSLVRAVVELGHGQGMFVTAEGVETDGQLTCLRQLGCDMFQGYLFSRPVPQDQFVKLLERVVGSSPVA